jgi:hypothetical protein
MLLTERDYSLSIVFSIGGVGEQSLTPIPPRFPLQNRNQKTKYEIHNPNPI